MFHVDVRIDCVFHKFGFVFKRSSDFRLDFLFLRLIISPVLVQLLWFSEILLFLLS